MTASYTRNLQCQCYGRLILAVPAHVCACQLACSRGTQHLRTNRIARDVCMLRWHRVCFQKHRTRHYQTAHQFRLRCLVAQRWFGRLEHSPSAVLPYDWTLQCQTAETQTSIYTATSGFLLHCPRHSCLMPGLMPGLAVSWYRDIMH